MKHPSRVAIVGRPNVGKSTLFNRITKARRALVHSDAGVTRDVQRLPAEWTGVAFELVDTGGLFSGIEDSLIQEVEKRALDEALTADVMIFVTDAQVGITPADRDIADRIRQLEVPVFLAANKSERRVDEHSSSDFYGLGFDTVYPVSALHGHGVGDLLDAVVGALPKRTAMKSEDDLKLALIGRPNVGKSSIINALAGDNVHIVDARPGTTRDSVDVTMKWYGRSVTLVDTAGLARKSRSKDGLTSLTALKAIDAAEKADIVALVIDAERGIANQDVKVAAYAHKAGKGVFICVNKWDLIADKTDRTVPEFEKELRRTLRFISYAPTLYTSALTGQRVSRIFELAWQIKESREQRVSTHEINEFFAGLIASNPPPYHGGGTGRIYYVTQVDVAPPTFTCFVNRRDYFGRPYLRFLNNRIRQRYGFEGTLIRIKLMEKRHGEYE